MLPTLPPTPHGPIPLSTRNISIQSTAERRHHHLYGCKCTLNADNAHGSAHVRAIQWHLHHWHLAGCCDGKWDGLAGHVRERTTSLRAQTSTAWSEQSPLPVLRPARHAGDRRAAHHVAQCMSGRVARRGGAVLQSRGLDGSTLHLHGQRIARARGRAHDVGRLGSGRRDVRRGLRVDSCATSGREKLVGAVRGITGGRARPGC